MKSPAAMRISAYSRWDLTFLRLLFTLLSYGTLILVTFLFFHDQETRWLIILAGLTLLPVIVRLDWFFRGREQMGYVGLAGALPGLLILGLVVWLVRDPTGLLLVPCIQFVGALAGSIFLIVLFLQEIWLDFFFVQPGAADEFVAQDDTHRSELDLQSRALQRRHRYSWLSKHHE